MRSRFTATQRKSLTSEDGLQQNIRVSSEHRESNRTQGKSRREDLRAPLK
jgi:hypothetical protein